MKRADHRSRTLRAGRILLGNGGVIDCIVRDVSPDGARLKLGNPSPLPKAFALKFVRDDTTVRVELRWQRGDEAGVNYLDKPLAPPTR